MNHLTAKKLVLFSVFGTMGAMAFMAASILFPHPLMLVVAMSVGQGIAIFALALYLLGVALDLQSSGGSYLPVDEPPLEAEPPPEAGGGAPAA